MRLVVDNSGGGLLSEEPGRERNILFGGERRDEVPVTPCNAIALPLVDGLAVDRFAGPFCQALREGGASAQAVDKNRVFMHSPAIVRNKFGFVKHQISDDLKPGKGDNPAMGKANEKDPYSLACGDRLIQVRSALGYPGRRAFANEMLIMTDEGDLKLWEDRLEKWEIGGTLVPARYLIHLKRRWGVTTDWIYIGDILELPPLLQTELLKLRPLRTG